MVNYKRNFKAYKDEGVKVSRLFSQVCSDWKVNSKDSELHRKTAPSETGSVFSLPPTSFHEVKVL